MNPLANPEPLIRRVYAYVAYRLGPGPDAEDVTSDVFERAVRYRASYDRRRGEPLAWLVGIARRRLAELGESPTVSLDDTDVASAEELERAAVERLDVTAAVARLPQRDRELVALRYGADLTARQIATLLDLKVNAVEVALHRALARLRAELGEPAANRDQAAVRVRPLQPVLETGTPTSRHEEGERS